MLKVLQEWNEQSMEKLQGPCAVLGRWWVKNVTADISVQVHRPICKRSVASSSAMEEIHQIQDWRRRGQRSSRQIWSGQAGNAGPCTTGDSLKRTLITCWDFNKILAFHGLPPFNHAYQLKHMLEGIDWIPCAILKELRYRCVWYGSWGLLLWWCH